MNISSSINVYLNNLCVNNLNALNATIWATGCRFKKVFVTEAKLLLSNSEAWEVHTYEKGEILGFYDLPLFGKIVFSLPFGLVFYMLLFIVLFLAVAVMLIYILRRKKTFFKTTSGCALHACILVLLTLWSIF